MLVRTPAAGAVTVTVKLLPLRAPRAAIPGQVRVFAVNVAPPEALTKVAPVGRRSETTTLFAVEGPRFVTFTEYENVAPARTVEGPVLVTATSACCPIVVITIEAALLPSLFPVTGSGVPVLQEAMFVRNPLEGAEAVRVNTTALPLAKAGIAGQVTLRPDAVPPDEALRKLAPLGRRSDATMLLAVDGPMFVITIE